MYHTISACYKNIIRNKAIRKIKKSIIECPVFNESIQGCYNYISIFDNENFSKLNILKE